MRKTELKTKFGTVNQKYKQYRPTYPNILFDTILKNLKPPYQKAIDIGAGTGISTNYLSKTFNSVVAIEPDKKMTDIGSFDDIVVILNDCAENIELENGTFDLVTAGNSFYWMEAELILNKMYEWLNDNGIIAIYRYNMPLTDNQEINKFIHTESNNNWDKFRHERLKDTEYTFRNIANSPLFSNVDLININNTVPLKPEELVGFFASTSYVSAYLRSLDNPDRYLNEFLNNIKIFSKSSVINVNFSLELVLAHKNNI